MRPIIVVLTLLFVLSAQLTHAAGNINIHFPGAEMQQASLYVYGDLMNYQLNSVKKKNVDEKAYVTFQYETQFVQKMVVRIGYTRFSFYIEPGADYKIEVDTMDFNHPAMYPIQVINYLTPHYRIQRIDEGEDVNEMLNAFTNQYNAYLNRHYLHIYQKKNVPQIVDTAQQMIEGFMENIENQYVKTHADVQLGQLYMMSRRYGTKAMVERYFTADHIQYTNMAYMDFFNMYWKRYLINKTKAYRRFQLDSVVNTTASYFHLDRLLARDPMLADSTLRQLVLLRNLQDMYVDRKFDKKAIKTILIDIAGHAHHPQHERIATNMRKIFEKYEKGTIAPAYTLHTFDGKTLSLKDVEDKYVVLSFFNLKCMDCLAELDYMAELYEEFHDIITFISISTDQNMDKAEAYVKAKEYKWDFAYYNHDLFDNYNVTMMPTFILIDKEGKIENFDCPRPSQYFQDYFIQMLNEKKGNLD